MSYVNVMVAAVPTDKKEEYKQSAQKAYDVFRKYGMEKATEYWGVSVPKGEITSFPKAVLKEDNETVAVATMYWPSKETHDLAMLAVVNDPDLDMGDMPFDGQRMIFGSFEVLLEA